MFRQFHVTGTGIEFQFLKGAIKCKSLCLAWSLASMFQFLKGAIK